MVLCLLVVLLSPVSCNPLPLLQNAARRNALLSHVSAALRQLQHQLDAVDAFVGHHFKGPWEAAGMKDAHRHWLDTVARLVDNVTVAGMSSIVPFFN